MITFALPTWNRGEQLRECVESLAFQKPECIVIADDGSTDNTPEVGFELEQRFSFVKYLRFEHAGFAENYKRAIKASESEYTWTFGDDDILCPTALDFMRGMLKTSQCDFYHVAETTRIGKAEAMAGTGLDICNWIGWLDFTGFISGNIGKTEFMQAGVDSENWKLYSECSYPQSLAILEQFHHRPSMMVELGCVESCQGNAETVERWGKQEVCWKYLYIADGLKLLRDNGTLPRVFSETFFRYLQEDLFSRFMRDFNGRAVLNPDLLTERDWECFLSLAEMVIDPRGKMLHDWIMSARELSIKYKDVFKASAAAYAELSTAVSTIQMPVYPIEYLP